ncbi:hypothetical protein GALL_548270 [mine drainage metagenome]|uniref:Uncharacterized protein n=1 Tax=mine drainage metagenome TaxID=410659 RepID=A0A1J5NZF5_9ZZZZ
MLRRAGHRTRFAERGIFRHAMRDEIDRVIPRHVLFLQEIGGVGLAFRKDRDEDVGACHLSPARALHMDRRALNHALERGGRHRL